MKPNAQKSSAKYHFPRSVCAISVPLRHRSSKNGSICHRRKADLHGLHKCFFLWVTLRLKRCHLCCFLTWLTILFFLPLIVSLHCQVHVIIEESMFLLFEPIYSFRQSSSVNTASHGPLSHVEINTVMVTFRKAKIAQKPQYHIYLNGTGRELLSCTFTRQLA